VIAMCPGGAGAATIVVDQTGDLTGSFDDPGGCNLRDAVTAANTNAPFSDCPGDSGGGTGADTILLQGGLTYTLTNHAAPEAANASGDLDITGGGGTTIRSTGAGLATIDADSVKTPVQGAATRDRAIEVMENSGGLTLERIRIINGASSEGGGGGIQALAPLTLVDSEVSGNSVGLLGGFAGTGGGGILLSKKGSLTMSGSTVAGNVVKASPSSPVDAARGGGIAVNSNAPVTITNSTISGNRVDSAGNTTNVSFGGGIFWIGAQTMELTNVTISNNSAVNSAGAGTTGVAGGGLAIYRTGVTLRGTIVAGNLAPTEPDCSTDETFISAGDNVIGSSAECDHTGGSNDTVNVGNPQLAPLSNYGGLTPTQLPNPGSPAIDHGGTCPGADQRGFMRGPVAPCDAGAVEAGAVEATPANDIAFGKVKRNKKKGTALLPVQVPGAGELELAGKGLKPATVTAAGAGEASLTVKATGKAKRKLRRRGKRTFEPVVTFTPDGGVPSTESTQVKLVRK
jgi:hypothetical protein